MAIRLDRPRVMRDADRTEGIGTERKWKRSSLGLVSLAGRGEEWKKIPWVTHGIDLRHFSHESLMGRI